MLIGVGCTRGTLLTLAAWGEQDAQYLYNTAYSELERALSVLPHTASNTHTATNTLNPA
jgi:hypothetical protein